MKALESRELLATEDVSDCAEDETLTPCVSVGGAIELLLAFLLPMNSARLKVGDALLF